MAGSDRVALEVEWERHGKRIKMGKKGKYQGTVLGQEIVVPFRHCPWREKRAISGLCGQGSC
jgi:hypothetical protein